MSDQLSERENLSNLRRGEFIDAMIREARRIIGEIDQLFAEADSWNENVRPPESPPIDVDPDGKLEDLRTNLREFIGKYENEEARDA